MKKAIVIVIAVLASLPAAFAQYGPENALPEQGQVRLGIGWGWAFNMHFENDCHTKPINPLMVTADYTVMTFADDQGSVAAGALFEWCRYQTWSTDKQIQTVGFKTTHTWNRGVLAAQAVVRYCFGQDFEAFGQVFIGRNLQLGYEEEYSDPSYESIIPHTSGPGSFGAWGLTAGIGRAISEHMGISFYLGLGTYTTLGINAYYKF